MFNNCKHIGDTHPFKGVNIFEKILIVQHVNTSNWVTVIFF